MGVEQLKKPIFGILLVTIMLSALVFVGSIRAVSFEASQSTPQPQATYQEFTDDFGGQVLGSGWSVENIKSNYSLSNGILTLSSDAGANTGIALYRDFTPQTDNFTVSTRVKASVLDFLALRIQFKSLPIILPGGTGGCATLQVRPDRFIAVITSTELEIYRPTATGVWYILEMKVQNNPFKIEFNVYNDGGTLLGTQTITISGFSYADIHYISLQLWNTGQKPVYDIDWLKISANSLKHRTLVVDANGTGDFSIIQDAINAASSGDTVYVKTGVYYEHVVINKTLSLLGESKDSTIIDGSNNGYVVDVTANNVSISQFLLQNAGSSWAGVNVESSGVTIWNNSMMDNHGGVWVRPASLNTTISGNKISNKQPSYADGIRLWSSGTLVVGNIITNESSAIGVDVSGNTIEGNFIANNSIGIGNSPASLFFHNSFVNNDQQATPGGSNIWDDGYPSGGNYWSDYKGTDNNGDGIGDTPYVIDAHNKDNYPLMKTVTVIPPTSGPTPTLTVSCRSTTTYNVFKVEVNGNLTFNGTVISAAPILLSYSVTGGSSWENLTLVNTNSDGSFSAVWMPSVTGNYLIKASWNGNATYSGVSTTVNLAVMPLAAQNVFSVASNSTVSDLAFNSTSQELSFTVTGSSGTTGYVDVYIAKTLINDIGQVKAYVNGNEVNYAATQTDDSWLLHFTYQHSTHTVVISLGTAATQPDQNSTENYWIYGLLVAIIVILTVSLGVVWKKRNRKPQN